MKTNLHAVGEEPPPSRWYSDAERHGLPTANRRDNKGAPLLEVERVVKASYPPLPDVETKRAWWARVFRKLFRKR